MNEPGPTLEEHLFEAALAKSSAEERAAFLDGVCRGSPALRARLEVLLEGHFQAADFLPSGPTPIQIDPKPALPQTKDEAAPRRIGRYKLLEKIGEGGFGEVWMAEQKEPVKRRVALKIIKLGMDTRQVVARFEAERQALALMDHPNIAKVLDGGATETGRPYFVMELVRGVRITDYCDQNHLPTEERLKLFILVCRAIQHAHQKGIIHRDIKPSNILITLSDGLPVPKVIDFGIAKATQMELTEKTVFTQFHQFLGTPAYVSPEQASMSSLDVDTRSDIYSLGVLLYELLTGTTPFDTQELLKAGLEGMRHIICEREPIRPSTRLNRALASSPANDSGQSKIKNQKSKISSDLDWIVMKCLEKDRAWRYETANGLARDVERHLNNEPVLARPPSWLYEFQKSVRRHWVGFATVGAVVMALTIGVLLSSIEAIRARRAERVAQGAQAQETKQRAASQQFLYQSLIGEARATRLARRLGYRDKVFALLEQAKALDVPQKDLGELRQEAVACLGDFVGLRPATFTDFATNIVSACLDPAGKLAAFAMWDCTIQLREIPSGKLLTAFRPTNEFVQDLCFDSKGDHLYASYGLPSARLYCWTPSLDASWQETKIQALPPNTTRLVSSELGVFAVKMSQLGHPVPFTLYGGVVRKVVELASGKPSEIESPCFEFRLLDAQTGELVPGYEVTNLMPWSGAMSFYVSGDAGVLAVETGKKQNPNPSGLSNEAPSLENQNQNQNPQALVKDRPTPAEKESSNSVSLVNLYDWKTGRRMGQFQRPINGSLSGDSPLTFSVDGKYVVSLTELGGTIYTLPDLERVTQFTGPYYGKPSRICGDTVALPEANRIRLWSLRRREDIALLDGPNDVWPSAFTPDGNWLLAVGGQHAFLYRLITPEKLDLPNHAGAAAGAAFSPDGRRLASVGKDRVIRVCDALTGRILWETNDLPGLGQCVSYSPDGQWLAIGVWDKDLITIRDAQTGRWMRELGTGRVGRNTYCVQFSPDGRYLAVGADITRVWAVNWDKSSETNGSETTGAFKARLINSWGAAMDPIFSPDSRWLAFCAYFDENVLPPEHWADSDRPLYLWDLSHSAQPRRIASRILGLIESGGFTPNGRRLLAVDVKGDIVTLEVPTGKRIAAVHADDPQFDRLALGILPSPDGSKLAVTLTPPAGGAVSIMDPQTGHRLYSLPAETGAIYWVAWSPDSRRLAVSRDNGKIAIWDLEAVHQILAHLGLKP